MQDAGTCAVCSSSSSIRRSAGLPWASCVWCAFVGSISVAAMAESAQPTWQRLLPFLMALFETLLLTAFAFTVRSCNLVWPRLQHWHPLLCVISWLQLYTHIGLVLTPVPNKGWWIRLSQPKPKGSSGQRVVIVFIHGGWLRPTMFYGIIIIIVVIIMPVPSSAEPGSYMYIPLRQYNLLS